MLADDTSIRILTQLLSFRLTGNPALHPVVTASEQYLPADLRTTDLTFPRPITFVDGGAFTGDTGLLLASNGVAFSEWIAFEPDLSNFEKLVETASQLSQTRCTFFPLGLSDRNEDCSFDAQDSAASRLGGSTTVRCVAIELGPGRGEAGLCQAGRRRRRGCRPSRNGRHCGILQAAPCHLCVSQARRPDRHRGADTVHSAGRQAVFAATCRELFRHGPLCMPMTRFGRAINRARP